MEDDDLETFLCTFERTAQREGWPKPEWASLLAPYLSGKAQKAYFDLNADQAANYERLKREILSRYSSSHAVHNWSMTGPLTPPSPLRSDERPGAPDQGMATDQRTVPPDNQ